MASFRVNALHNLAGQSKVHVFFSECGPFNVRWMSRFLRSASVSLRSSWTSLSCLFRWVSNWYWSSLVSRSYSMDWSLILERARVSCTCKRAISRDWASVVVNSFEASEVYMFEILNENFHYVKLVLALELGIKAGKRKNSTKSANIGITVFIEPLQS